MDAAALERLVWKYQTLIALRARREEVEATGAVRFGDAEGALRRNAFRMVAGHFPGALRELDRTSRAALERKLAAVEDERVRPTGCRWIQVTIDFHDTLREALAVKMWLARRIGRDGEIGDGDVAAFGEWHEQYERPPHGVHCVGRELGRSYLAAHHHPPRGRVLSIVWGALAERHAETPAELEVMVFGPR